MNILDVNRQTFKLADTVLYNQKKHKREEFEDHYATCVKTLITVNGEGDADEAKPLLKKLNDINKRHTQIKNLPPKQ